METNSQITLECALSNLSSENRTIREMRGLIRDLESTMFQMPDRLLPSDFKTVHHFAPGIYMRELFIPKGVTLVGKIHKTEHMLIISQGDISVMTDEGIKRLKASSVVHTMPGMKRVMFAHEDSVCITSHYNPTNERDLDKIDSIFVAETPEEYLKFSEQKQLEEGVKL